MVDVFISYSRKDISFARILYESIVSRNKEVWIDWEDIPPSTDWLQEIFSAIESADTFIFIISKNSITSDICGLEISHAIKNSKKIIPIVIPGPNPSKIPPSLSKLNWIEFPTTTGEEFQKAFEDLLQTIETDLDWVKSLTKMQNLALDWERSNHEKSRLIDGQLLASAKQLFLDGEIQKSPEPSALLLEFLTESIQNKNQKRVRSIVSLFASILVIALISIFAFHQLKISRAQKMAVQAEAYFEQKDFHLASLFALRSNQLFENELANEVISKIPFENFPLAKGMVGHLDGINDVEWSKSGELASASYDGTIIIWDLETRTPKKILRYLTFKEFFDVDSNFFNLDEYDDIAWSNDGRLASAGGWGEVIIWDLTSQKPSLVWKNQVALVSKTKIVWSPDGKFLAGSGMDTQVRLWNTETGTLDRTLEVFGDHGSIRSLAWSESGLLAAGTSQGLIILWNIDETTPKRIIETNQGAINSLDWSAEGVLASGSESNTISVWDQYSDEPIKVFSDNYGEATRVSWSPSGQLASSTSDNRVILWDFVTEKPAQILRGHADSVRAIDWSPAGQLASGSADATVLLWDTNYQESLHYLEGQSDAITEVVWSPSDQLTSASEDGMIRIWDMATGAPVVTLNDDNGIVQSIAWSPSGELASVSGFSENTRIIIWNLKKQTPEYIIHTKPDSWDNEKFWHDLGWSPDGKLACTTLRNDMRTIIWDQPDSDPIKVFETSSSAIAWSPEGHLAIGGFGEDLTLWDPQKGEKDTFFDPFPQRYGDTTRSTTSMAWSRDGILASGFFNGRIFIWDLDNEKNVRVLEYHDGNEIVGVSWSRQNVLVSASRNGQITFWTPGTYEPYLTWKDPGYEISSIDWSADGRLAVGNKDGTIKVSRSELTGLESCEWVFRNMTVDEWKTYNGFLSPYQPVCPNQYVPDWRSRLVYLVKNIEPLFFFQWFVSIWIPVSSSLVIYGGVIYMFIKGKKKAGYRYKRMR